MEIIKIPKKEGIIDRKTGRVVNRKLRVAAYARVSTIGVEQLNSYESQKKYYYEILKERCGARANGRRIGNVGRKFAFSSRIRCGFCGNCFTRRIRKV